MLHCNKIIAAHNYLWNLAVVDGLANPRYALEILDLRIAGRRAAELERSRATNQIVSMGGV